MNRKEITTNAEKRKRKLASIVMSLEAWMLFVPLPTKLPIVVLKTICSDCFCSCQKLLIPSAKHAHHVFTGTHLLHQVLQPSHAANLLQHLRGKDFAHVLCIHVA